MQSEHPRGLKVGYLFAFLLALALGVIGLVAPAAAKNECLVRFKGVPTAKADGGTLKCTDCDPSCDADKMNTKNKSCTFHLQVCANLPDATCPAANLKKIKVKGNKTSGLKSGLTPNGTNLVCGAAVDYMVKLKKNGRKKGIERITAMAVSSDRPKRVRVARLVLECDPQPAATCPSTTLCSADVNSSCCGPERIVNQSTGHCSTTTATTCFGDADCASGETCVTDGTLTVATLNPFPFPLGVVTTVDIGPAGDCCKHPAIVPKGGFSVPHFPIPALGYCSKVTALGCESGGTDGRATVWDGHAPTSGSPSTTGCGDADVIRRGDTSATDGSGGPSCGTLGTGCHSGEGGAAADTKGNIDTTIGDGSCDGAFVHTQLDIPVDSVTWFDSVCNPSNGAYPGCCTSADFEEGEGLVAHFAFILSPTTEKTSSAFTDSPPTGNGDGCAFAGFGPAGEFTDTGSPPPGPCCVVGQTASVVASGVAFSAGAPTFDLLFKSKIPTQITQCTTPVGGTCVLTTDTCAY